MKKQINPNWIKANEQPHLTQDVTLLKERIMDAIAFYHHETRSRKIYESILYYLIEWEYPQNW